MMDLRWILPLSLLVLLTACGTFSRSGGYFEDDGPGVRPPADIANIPDAVPKPEPLATSGNKPYAVYGKTYTPLLDVTGYRERGVASWYGKKFHGKRTSSGEPYDMYAMTAAHKTLPLPSYMRVRNLQNGRAIIVRVNDRGPFLHDRLIDLSYAGAAKLGILGTGTGIVEIEAIQLEDSTVQVAQSQKPVIEIIPSALAADNPPRPASVSRPKLYLQVGAFSQWDNAINLRTRLQRETERPIFIQSALVPNERAPDAVRLYRVRIGPLASVEEGDLLSDRVTQLGITDTRIVVE